MYANVANLRPSIVFSFTLISYVHVNFANNVDYKSLKKKIFDTTVSKRDNILN